jgi:small-conductance mechanosensitive channel
MQDVFALDRSLFAIGGTPVTVASIITFVLFLGIAFLLSGFLRKGLLPVYQRRGVDVGVQYALNRLLHYVVIALGIFLALENLGVSLTALAGLGAILAVGIGFGLQNITQNFVGGLILLLERPVKQGDFVEVGWVKGSVRQIRARATVVTTLDNVDIIVPNGQFITEQVVNQTLDNRRVRASIRVGVAYGSDIELVGRTLGEVARTNPTVLIEPAPSVLFVDFGESSLDFILLVWLADPLLGQTTASELRFAIDRAFRERGIEIPFPQRDLHLRSGPWLAGAQAVG